ncbi:replicative DNA helicase dnaB (plastid) [Nitzschia inconspicua]|uniref:Replicative DNA helicase n=1 Tax=Nitzschia inconspicua TaxID=303405 RepID=A0A8H2SIB9_9STRA|nr:replicative DNA helicase dnaB [Nitzschia inconspicua]
MVKNKASYSADSMNRRTRGQQKNLVTKKQTKKSLFTCDEQNNVLKLNVQLPHSFTLEKTLLSCILVHCDESFQTLEIIMEHLPIDAFYFKNHQRLYETFICMYQEDRSIDFLTTSDYVQCYGQIKDIGGLFVLSELLKEIPTLVYLLDYIHLVKQKYIRRCIIKIGLKAVDNGFIMNFPISDQLLGLDAEIRKLTATIQVNENERTTAELLTQIVDDLWLRLKQPGQLSGLPSGFPSLDSYTDGFQKSELIIIAGRPSVGKTAFGLNLLLNVLKKTRLPVLFFSLEMSAHQLLYRLLSIETRLNQNKFKTGLLNQEDWEKINLVMRILGKIPMHLYDSPHLSTLEIRRTLKNLDKTYSQIGLIIIDYLQLMENPTFNTANRAQEISTITRELKNIAREFNVPIIALSQLSRTIESRLDQKPMLSDLRDSGSIEQDADLVLMLYKNNQNLITNLNPGFSIIDLSIAKQRNGPIGNIRFAFNEYLTKFEDYDILDK